jgi:hypothetical protein
MPGHSVKAALSARTFPQQDQQSSPNKNLKPKNLMTDIKTIKAAPFRATLKAMTYVAAILLPAIAIAEAPPSAPAEVATLAPAGTKLIFFKASGTTEGSDAVAVFEASTASGPAQRDLLVLRKKDGVFRLADRNDKLIACSTCGQFMDDPFLNDGDVSVTPGHIRISQMDSGENQSGVNYQFAYDPATSTWKVTGGERVVAADMGHDPAKTQKAALPASGLLKDVDAHWAPVSYWNGVVVNDKDHSFFSSVSVKSEQALDAELKKECTDASSCHVVIKQQNGCYALVKDENQAFFTATVAKKRSADEASAKALAECKAHGKGKCEIQRNDCSTGFD